MFPPTVDAPRAATSTAAALSTKMSGGVLLSHAVPRAVPSALKGLTSGFGMGPGVSPSPWPPKLYGDVRSPDRTSGTAQWTQTHCLGLPPGEGCMSQAARPISTGQLHPLLGFHIRPINPVVYWEPYPLKEVGVLISKQASRLDAFSGYPSRT